MALLSLDALRKMNKIFAIVIFGFGFFATYALYSINETGDLKSFGALIPILIASMSSLLISTYFHKKFRNNTKRFLFSILFSYLSYIFLMIVASAILGELSELLMWSVIIIMFGIPFMFPLTSMSWFAVFVFFGNTYESQNTSLERDGS